MRVKGLENGRLRTIQIYAYKRVGFENLTFCTERMYLNHLKDSSSRILNQTEIGDLKLEYHLGDITSAQAEAIVNQLVPELDFRVGMGRAFLDRCGPELEKDFREILSQ